MSNLNSNDFFERVFFLVKQIPIGRVSTYGAIAKKIGSASSSRMVGYAMNASHQQPGVPAHRVVNRNGQLTGKHHFASQNLMEELLKNEGVMVENDEIIDFKNIFWENFKLEEF